MPKNIYEEVHKNWTNHLGMPKDFSKSLEKMTPKEQKAAFGTPLSFGTAGIRGTMGVGTSHINIYTMSAAAYAYGQYLIRKKKNYEEKGVVIGHDNRHNSKEFSLRVAQVLGALGIKVFLYENNDLQPTPFVSFTIRKMKLAGAVIITASHNPKEYNGFKVYDDKGAQLLPNETEKVSAIMQNLDILNISWKTSTKILYISRKLADQYIKEILKLQLRPTDSKVLKTVFTPQHGTSRILIPRLLQNMNVNYLEVKSQMTVDPNFSHTIVPNPEDPRAFKKAVLLARRTKSDMAISTDPDADRIGVVVRHKKRYKYLNGNQTGALYLNFLLTELRKKNKIPINAYIVKSVVSGDLVDKIAEKFNVDVFQTHVGFKNIANFIEKRGSKNFLFAFEESYGFLLNPDIARDKDSIQAALGLVEAANYYKTQNSNLYQELTKLYTTYGHHRSHTYGLKMSQATLDKVLIRLSNLRYLGGVKISHIEDYRKGHNGLDPQNLLKIFFKEKRGWVAIRPSGTEPKIKIYLNLVNPKMNENIIFEKAIKENILDFIENEDTSKLSFRSMIKYMVFAGILISIFVILLFSLYNKNGSSTAIFKIVFDEMRDGSKMWLLLLMLFSLVFPPTITAIYTIRAMKLLHHKVSLRHAWIAAYLSICISAITPFATGGAIASYWYMRKKGYARSEIMSTYFMSSLLYQSSLAIRTIIFLPLSLFFFQKIFFAGTIASDLILFLTMFGLVFDIFAAFMIGLLTFSKKTHLFIVKNATLLLEWLNIVKDPEAVQGKYLYEMAGLRKGMNKLWIHKWSLLELLSYEMIPIFISTMFFTGKIVASANDVNLAGGLNYLKFITGQNIIRVANNMIPTPGASGTTEWMTSEIYRSVFGKMKTGSIGFTALNRLWTYIAPIFISATILILVYANEKVNSKIKMRLKNHELNSKNVLVIKNKFRIWATIGVLGFFASLGVILFFSLIF